MPEATPTDPAPARACSECGAPQDERQEICIECGHAASPSDRGHVRRALPTLSLAAFAVLVVASAAYGLTAGGAGNVRDLGLVKPKPPATVASAAPAPAGTTPAPAPPATPAPPASPGKPAPKPTPSSKPKPAAPTPATTTPSVAGSSPSTGGSRPHHGSVPARSHPHRHHAQSGPSWLTGADSPYSASVYDPKGAGAGEHGSAAPRAIDGRTRTAWTTADHPGGLGKPGVGLVVEAGGYQGYSGLGIQTATPGFSVSVYSTDEASAPTGDPNASAWRLEATKRGVAKQQRVALKGATAQPTYLLVWITKLPAGKPRAGLSEISLLP